MALKHKINKLRNASWSERLFRLRAAVDGRREHLQHALGRDAWDDEAFRDQLQPGLFDSEANLAHALLTWRRDHRSARFYFEPPDKDALISVIQRHFPKIVSASIEEAEAAYQQKVRLYGTTVQFEGRIPWTSDPISRKPWPMRFYLLVDTSVGRQEGVDIRYSDELNRHQFLVPLAKAYWLTGESKYAEKCLALVADWIDANPYKVGVNWTSALEVAFRSISWMWMYHFLLRADVLTPDLHQKWLVSICQHADFLFDHLSFYSSPYNHLIGEVCGLYLIASLFPLFRQAPQWKEKAWQVLCNTVERQFYPDGGTVEQATFYHHATLGFYLLACILREKNGEDIPSHVRERIEKAHAYTMALMRPDGSLPMAGDVDDGRSIRVGKPAFHWDFRAFLSIGAVIFDRPDMKAQSEGFHEDALWLLGVDGWQAYQRLEAQSSQDGSVELPDSGYYVMRSGSDKKAHMLCFDCGEQADGLFTDATPSAAHGHADCLSIDLCVGGQPFIVDPGFNTYNGAPNWRDYFRKTRAHNTVEVDGRDQSEHLGRMDWCRVFTHQLDRWVATPIVDFVAGSHDGYTRRGVTHHRAVYFRRPDYWLICDELRGRGKHEAVNYWHMAPEIQPEVRDDGCHLSHPSGQKLLLRASANAEPEIITATADEPASGWVCPGYGQKTPASLIRFNRTVKLPARWYTLLFPYTGKSPNISLEGLDTGLRIRTSRFEDLLLFLPGKKDLEHIDGIKTDAESVNIRRHPETGRVLTVWLTNGQFLWVGDQLSFVADRRLDYVAIVNEGAKRIVFLSPVVGYTIS